MTDILRVEKVEVIKRVEVDDGCKLLFDLFDSLTFSTVVQALALAIL